MDLLQNGCISMEKKKITVIQKMPLELEHLAPLYAYLEEKPRSLERLMDDYVLSMGGRVKQLAAGLGASLVAAGMATEGKGGLFGSKVLYLPVKSHKEQLVDALRSALAQEGEMSPHDVALLSILKETKCLKQYLSKSERDAWKARLKEIKKNPQNKQLAKMVNYVGDMTALLASWIVMHTN